MKPSIRIPSYRFHRASKQAVVTIGGRDFYLGPWNSPESRAEYDRLIGEWMARGRQAPPQPVEDRTPYLKEVILGYYNHCVAILVPVEVEKVHDALKLVREMYGNTKAADFNAISYAAVRSKMVESKLCITTIRARLSVIKKMVAWGVVREMIPDRVPNLIKALEQSEPLRIGQPGVKPPRKVLPVPEDRVRAIMPFVTPTVRAMLELQLHTGMRPGEVCRMTAGQIDMSGENWIYRPAKHKTKHLGKDREITIGPKAQETLRPWLKDDPDAILFSPRESYERSHEASKRGNRVRKATRKPRRFRAAYTKGTYATAVVRACDRAGVPVFRPNAIRHTYGTKVRKEFGLEAAQVMLGHSRADITQVYAESNRELARDVAKRLG